MGTLVVMKTCFCVEVLFPWRSERAGLHQGHELPFEPGLGGREGAAGQGTEGGDEGLV